MSLNRKEKKALPNFVVGVTFSYIVHCLQIVLVKYVRPSSTEGKAPYVWTLATIQKLICQNYRDVNYLIECYWLCAPILTFERYFSFLIIQGHFQIYTVHQCKWDLITAKCWYFYLFLQEQQDKTTPLPGVLFFIFIFSKRPMGKWWSFAATWCLWERWWWWPLDDFFLILKWRKWPHQWITAMVELVTQMCFPTNDDNKNDSSSCESVVLLHYHVNEHDGFLHIVTDWTKPRETENSSTALGNPKLWEHKQHFKLAHIFF